MDLFNRHYTLTVGSTQIRGANGVGLRVSFRVHESIEKDPNTCEVKIFNLSKENRERLNQRGAPLVLSAGYSDTEATIFSGQVRFINHELEGPTWVTKVTAGDAERVFAFSRFSKAYAGGVSVGTVLREAVAATSLNPGNLESALALAPRGGLVSFTRGYTAHGPVMDTINTLAKSIGFKVSVQRGALRFLSPKGVAPGAAVLLTPGSGLVGSPTYSSPSADQVKKGQTPRVIAKSLLQPSIQCGGQVNIQCEGVKGAFRVQKLDHTGDFGAGEWYTGIEVQAL